jgi:hypothetical protein
MVAMWTSVLNFVAHMKSKKLAVTLAGFVLIYLIYHETNGMDPENQWRMDLVDLAKWACMSIGVGLVGYNIGQGIADHGRAVSDDAIEPTAAPPDAPKG